MSDLTGATQRVPQGSDSSQSTSVGFTRGSRHERWYWGRGHDDIDPVVVDRLIAGHRIPANVVERREAVRQMHARGFTYSQMCARLGVAERRVWGDLAALGLAQPRRRTKDTRRDREVA